MFIRDEEEPCWQCDGSGWLPAYGEECEACNGTGLLFTDRAIAAQIAAEEEVDMFTIRSYFAYGMPCDVAEGADFASADLAAHTLLDDNENAKLAIIYDHNGTALATVVRVKKLDEA